MKIMTAQAYINQSHEFDRQIKEATQAAHYALSIVDKLACIRRARKLQQDKENFRRKYMNSFD